MDELSLGLMTVSVEKPRGGAAEMPEGVSVYKGSWRRTVMEFSLERTGQD